MLRQMHHIFEGGASWTPEPEATRTEALRLVIGRLWTLIVEKLGKPDGSLHLYSGHDWSVSPLLMCIVGRTSPLLHSWPPFCSNIAFELWSTRKEDIASPRILSHPASRGDETVQEEGRYVRVLYNGQPVEMVCSHGSDTCSLADFKQMLKHFCVHDFEEEGRLRDKGPIHASVDSGFNR